MMANYDIMCFLEYYSDRTNIVDGSGNRVPTRQWQNFFPTPQTLSIDSAATGSYGYLPFEIDGFGSTEAKQINDLMVNVAASADIVDVSEDAIGSENYVIASLYLQTAGFDSFNSGSAQLIARYSGSIEGVSANDISVDWTINPAISKIDAQVPSKKISSGMTQSPFLSGYA